MECVPVFWNNPAENAGKIQAMDRVLQINSSEVFVVGGGRQSYSIPADGTLAQK